MIGSIVPALGSGALVGLTLGLLGVALGPVAGGVLVRDASGGVIGAAGASGDVSDKDEACILAGVAAAGLNADTGAPA